MNPVCFKEWLPAGQKKSPEQKVQYRALVNWANLNSIFTIFLKKDQREQKHATQSVNATPEPG